MIPPAGMKVLLKNTFPLRQKKMLSQSEIYIKRNKKRVENDLQ